MILLPLWLALPVLSVTTVAQVNTIIWLLLACVNAVANLPVLVTTKALIFPSAVAFVIPESDSGTFTVMIVLPPEKELDKVVYSPLLPVLPDMKNSYTCY